MWRQWEGVVEMKVALAIALGIDAVIGLLIYVMNQQLLS